MKNILLYLFMLGVVYSVQGQDPLSKIDHKLLEKDGILNAVVVLKNQHSTETYKSLNGKLEKGASAYESLYDHALHSQKDLIEYLESQNIRFRSYYIVNMVSIHATLDQLNTIAMRPEVAKIIEDGQFVLDEPIRKQEVYSRATEWGLDKINAPAVWNLGYTGQNIIIGGQDTGYEWEHDALKDKYKGWDGSTANHDYHWHDAIHNAGGSNPCGSDSPFPCDDHNHGTHTMGTMTGDDGVENQIGVAPGAKWIGCRNMDQGHGTLSSYVECFEWFLAPYPVGQTPAQGDPSQAPHVINNSWSCPPSEGCNTSNFPIMEMALNNLRNAGIVVVVSNGNSGSSCSSTNSPPAFFKNSFSVGATNSSDGIAGFSSRGPITIDGSNRLKPEISAPGVSVRSSIRNNGYTNYNGTSMAGPHVAGTVALILSANPNLEGEVDEIETIIKETAVQLTTSQDCGNVDGNQIPNNTFGFGRINALAAVNRAVNDLHVPIIKIDQFGYKTGDSKIAILSDPQDGYNELDNYSPSGDIEVKDAITHETIYSGSAVSWNSGNEDPLSGDVVWWFDFSSVTTPGTYYISDNSIFSETFVINDNVYNDLLTTTFKTFYYQRCGHDKTSPYVHSNFHDSSCHAQDLNCKFIDDPMNNALYKDLSGGWHDAGDYNKYVNFAYQAVLDLLFAYEYNPQSWSDNMGLPESNNGIPDLLDEVKYELDWLLKMQDTDGGVHCIVGVQNFATATPPSNDTADRYYGKKTTSASYSTAAMMALASIQFKKINHPTAQTYAATLAMQADSAYNWAVSNPNEEYYNAGIIGAGEQEINDGYEVNMRRLAAAIFLYKVTDNIVYKNYVESNYLNAHMMQWNFVYPFESPIQHALLFYTTIEGASSAVVTNIKNAYKSSVENSTENIPSIINQDDAYRSYIKASDIVWGSNSVKCNKGNIYQAYNHYLLNPSNLTLLNESVGDFIHYQHGVNPTGLTYLTNMADLGSNNSINSVYHGWFEDGSIWDDKRTSLVGPAPGFLSGGPNPSWNLDACCPSGCGANNADCITLTPPYDQPPLKSYRDWNTSWPQNSWSVTETAIYYQSAYLLLLSSKTNISTPLNSNDKLVSFDSHDLIIDSEDKGIVLHSPNGTGYRINVHTDGSLTITPNPTIIDESSRVIDGNIYFQNNESGLILKDANQNLWRLQVNNAGGVETQPIATSPLELTKQPKGDFVISSIDQGVILKDYSENCFLITISDSSELFTKPIACPY